MSFARSFAGPFVVGAIAVAAGCGGGSGGGGGGGDDEPLDCPVADVGDAATIDPEFTRETGDGAIETDFYSAADALNMDATPDVLFVEFWAGFGSFEDGYPAGETTIDLSTEGSNYNDCGVCALVIADLTETSDPNDVYFHQSGTVTITSLTDDLIEIDVADLVLVHSTIDVDGVTTPVGDGCSLTIGSASFSGVPEGPEGPQPMPAQARTRLRRR